MARECKHVSNVNQSYWFSNSALLLLMAKLQIKPPDSSRQATCMHTTMA